MVHQSIYALWITKKQKLLCMRSNFGILAPMLFFLDFDRTIFDTEKFYNALEKGLIIPSEALSLESIEQYMYEDTLPFLQRRTEMGDTLILVTRGELVIQKTKVENSGIASFFLEKLYVQNEESKDAAISAYLGRHEVTGKTCFVDDTISELEAVKAHCPEVLVVRMRRSTAKNAGTEAPHLLTAATFAELESVVT